MREVERRRVEAKDQFGEGKDEHGDIYTQDRASERAIASIDREQQDIPGFDSDSS